MKNDAIIGASHREKQFVALFFLLLWTYLIIRACNVFYIHDEIVTKWTYMVNWNFLPGSGYIDANNHFLTSFFGGLFLRLFNSDAMLIIRLSSILSFPLFFWSIVGMRSFFRNRVNYYALLIGLTCTAFLLEYFAFARGYGMSFAFLVAAMLQMMKLFRTSHKAALILATIFWSLAICANLTLIPFGSAAAGLMLFFTIKNRMKFWIFIPLIVVLPLAYLVNYSFLLQDLGKLYSGGEEGFFVTTIHTLTPYIWGVKNVALDIVLVLVTLFIGFRLLQVYWKERIIFDPKTFFALFLFLAIGNILAQHLIFGINYPSDRTALYLYVFFVGALVFTIDHATKSVFYSLGYSALTLVIFLIHFNIDYSILHKWEHVDEKLVSLIPDEIRGTPPTTGGRWAMENEMNRTLGLPVRMFQVVNSEYDTLVDYMIYTSARRPDIYKWYHPVYTEKVSGQTLFERNHFLSRTKTYKLERGLYGNDEFFSIESASFSSPKLVRISGQMNELTPQSDMHFVFSTKDTVSGEQLTYEAMSLVCNSKIRHDNSIRFDFSYAFPNVKEANQFDVYLWNPEGGNLSGVIDIEVFRLGD